MYIYLLFMSFKWCAGIACQINNVSFRDTCTVRMRNMHIDTKRERNNSTHPPCSPHCLLCSTHYKKSPRTDKGQIFDNDDANNKNNNNNNNDNDESRRQKESDDAMLRTKQSNTRQTRLIKSQKPMRWRRRRRRRRCGQSNLCVLCMLGQKWKYIASYISKVGWRKPRKSTVHWRPKTKSHIKLTEQQQQQQEEKEEVETREEWRCKTG